MSQIVSIHSFRGGTGKSNSVANIAALMAQKGLRVGVIDTDIQSPGIHVLFQLDETQIKYSLNDFLWKNCGIEDAAYDVTPNIGENIPGRVFLIPASIKTGEITRILREGYDVNTLSNGFYYLIDEVGLDVLLIDTHPGLNEETLLSIAISNTLLIILRPDQQDYLGTGVTVDIARKLDVPHLGLLVNKVPAAFSEKEISQRAETAYECPVAAVIPHADEMMTLASGGIFAMHYPHHRITSAYHQAVNFILGDTQT
jgi:MinD-like ATPase involved in chromosome partitioning or flagellar assembly